MVKFIHYHRLEIDHIEQYMELHIVYCIIKCYSESDDYTIHGSVLCHNIKSMKQQQLHSLFYNYIHSKNHL